MTVDDVSYRLVPVADESSTFKWAGHRVVQACRRLEDLEERFSVAAESWESKLSFSFDRNDPDSGLKLEFHGIQADTEDHAHELGALASEVVHHLRSALDYIAYHAAWGDSGQRNERAQFPLDSKESEWLKRPKSWLYGVSAEHLRWIKEVQPLGERNWAYNLRQLSNGDKHAIRINVLPCIVAAPAPGVFLGPHPNDPAFERVAVKEHRLDLLITVPEADRSVATEPQDAREVLWTIFHEVRTFVNRFLEEEDGVGPITYS